MQLSTTAWSLPNLQLHSDIDKIVNSFFKIFSVYKGYVGIIFQFTNCTLK